MLDQLRIKRSLIWIVVGAGASVLATLFVSRRLSAVDFGVYSYSIAWLTMLSLITPVGFHTLALRQIPIFLQNSRHSTADVFSKLAETYAIYWGAGSAILAFVTATILACFGADIALVPFLLAMCAVPMWAVQRVRAGILRGYGSIGAAIATNGPITNVVLALGVVSSTSIANVTVEAILVILLIGSICNLGISKTILRRLTKLSEPSAGDSITGEDLDWVESAKRFTFLSIAQVSLRRTDTIVIAAVAGPVEAGIFFLCQKIADVLQLPLNAVNTVLAPRVASLYSKGDIDALGAATRGGARVTLALGLVVGVPILLLAEYLIEFFGSDYVDTGVTCLYFLVAGQLVNSAIGSSMLLLTMTGLENVATRIVIYTGVFMLLLNSFLAWKFGAVGVSAGTVLSLLLWNGAAAIIGYRKIGVRTTVI